MVVCSLESAQYLGLNKILTLSYLEQVTKFLCDTVSEHLTNKDQALSYLLQFYYED